MAELLVGWTAVAPVGGHRRDADVDDLQPRLPEGVLQAADVRHDEIEPLAETARHVFEPGSAHLPQCRPVPVRAVPLHVDDQQRRRSRADLRFRKRRSPGDVGIIFAYRDHPPFSVTRQRDLRRADSPRLTGFGTGDRGHHAGCRRRYCRPEPRSGSPARERRQSTTDRSSCAQWRSSNPIRGRSGGGPRPRKLSVAKVRIACPRSSVPRITSGEMVLGRTWWRNMRVRVAPSACAARHELAVPRGQDQSAHIAGVGRPPGDHDGDDRVAHPRAQRRRDHHRQDDRRKSEHEVGERA